MGTAVLNKPAAPATSAVRPASGQWILNFWLDLLLFVATPLLIIPVVLLLQSPWVGVEVETIGVMVFSFGALGHHLPGMIRAYGDRELFQRFRARFIIAPLVLVAVAVAVAQYHLHTLILVILIWACWHGLMQIYGFVRIYDAKVGFHSTATAHWDWLLLASWFGTAQVFSDAKMADFLELWYQSGGLLISPELVHMFRWVCLGTSIAILLGFLTNHVVQTYRGRIENKPTPNLVKLLLLTSGIGFWWFAMVFVENAILGVAFFEIFHDVQYLAIVWLYNCRRVHATADLGGFMKFLFRRGSGMMLLYVGLVFTYGIYGFVHNRSTADDIFQRTLLGLVWASTILHYYYDGFIWKVREKSTRLGLGLNAAGNSQRVPQRDRGEWIHLLKCASLLFVIGWLAFGEISEAAFTPANKSDQAMVVNDYISRTQNIAAAVPGNLHAQQHAATVLANFGMEQEAINLLHTVLERHPSFADGQFLLGDLHNRRKEFDLAATCFEAAAKTARKKEVRAFAHHKLGEVYLQQKKTEAAKAEFHAALQIDPHFEESQQALRDLGETPPASH
jgi:hypothetical protein